MKRDRINYVLVGAGVLVALALLLATLFAITGRGGDHVGYFIYYDNVTGLQHGAPVFYEGYRIGQVDSIEPERNGKTRYRVNVDVREDWGIPNDSVARLQSSGLLADMSIGIREGDSKQMLQPGAQIKGLGGGDLFAAMNDLAGELTVLTRDRIRPLIDTLAQRIDSITGTVDDNLPEIVAQTRELMIKLNTAAANVNDIVGGANKQAIAHALADIRNVADELDETKARADQLLTSLNATVDENRPEIRQVVLDLQDTVGAIATRIDAITHHLESSSRNIDEFSREIRRNPNRLLFTPKADDVEEQ